MALSTEAWVGIGLAGAAILGIGIYVATNRTSEPRIEEVAPGSFGPRPSGNAPTETASIVQSIAGAVAQLGQAGIQAAQAASDRASRERIEAMRASANAGYGPGPFGSGWGTYAGGTVPTGGLRNY